MIVPIRSKILPARLLDNRRFVSVAVNLFQARGNQGLSQAPHSLPDPRRPACTLARSLPGPGFSFRCIDIQVMPACKCRVAALPVLTYPKVRSAPVLATRHFRRSLT
ncbi:hypothetical protein FJV76_13075 [Mesorhizobium sp. WSM4303]|nr:hypothetical protein FJV77_07185 [Mesorhizobium sp. WSM4306]TRD04234.1 hypothetical protein FJV76_13075 [Mesorhizobium sp. WSM4303]